MSFTSAMTILCSIIMCFKSLSCSATGKCSSQKTQGTDGGPSKAAGPPGLSGRESGSRMQSLLSVRGTEEEERKAETNSSSLHGGFLTFYIERNLEAFYIFKKKKKKDIAPERTLLSFKTQPQPYCNRTWSPTLCLDGGNPLVEGAVEVFLGPGQWLQF